MLAKTILKDSICSGHHSVMLSTNAGSNLGERRQKQIGLSSLNPIASVGTTWYFVDLECIPIQSTLPKDNYKCFSPLRTFRFGREKTLSLKQRFLV